MTAAEISVGDIVRLDGKRGLSYRVHAVDAAGNLEVFGGPNRQWRTVPASSVHRADARQRREFERAAEADALARGSIKAAKAVRAGRKART